MRIRLTGSANWQRVGADHFAVRLAEQNTVADVHVRYWSSDLPDAPDPRAWIERIASEDLPAEAELFGVTFSDVQSALGWPVTLIEGSVRWGSQSPSEARAVRLLYCLQILDTWAVIRVHAPVAHLAGGARTELLRVFGSAQPEQRGDEVVALADLWRSAAVGSSRGVL